MLENEGAMTVEQANELYRISMIPTHFYIYLHFRVCFEHISLLELAMSCMFWLTAVRFV